MGSHPLGSLCKSLIITVMGAGNRCVSLMESPESQSQMNAYYLKENKNILKSPTNRDRAEMVGIETSSASACGTLKDRRLRATRRKVVTVSCTDLCLDYEKKKKKEELECSKAHSSIK